jgi:hypothetical protein
MPFSLTHEATIQLDGFEPKAFLEVLINDEKGRTFRAMLISMVGGAMISDFWHARPMETFDADERIIVHVNHIVGAITGYRVSSVRSVA